MDFAIVVFTGEEDDPAIVSTNWITQGKNTCWYPNVRSEHKKKKFLLNRESPGLGWLQCPIKVLKEFANYQAARNQLNDAEEMSDLESGSEQKKLRSFKKRIICLSEDNSSDEVLRKSQLRYPTPPCIFSQTEKSASQHMAVPTNACASIPVAEQFNYIPHTFQHFKPSILADLDVAANNNLSLKTEISGISRQIDTLQNNQKCLWNAMLEMQNSTKEIIEKLDTLTRLVQENPMESQSQDHEDVHIFSAMPVKADDFPKLENMISGNPSSRLRLTQSLMTTSGRDARALAANVLRKLISDDIAETFSLTGRQAKTGLGKQPFEKTEVYKLVLEICFCTFNNTRENVVREAISDWLMQAKFRKIRREKRLFAVKEELPEPNL